MLPDIIKCKFYICPHRIWKHASPSFWGEVGMGFLVCVTDTSTVTKIFQSRMSKAQHVHKQPQLPVST